MDRRQFVVTSSAALVSGFVPLAAATAAEPTRRLRVLTYNIHHGEGIDGKLDLERIAALIRAAEPDLVSLQEVEHKTARTGHVPQAEKLAELTGLKSVFGGNIEFQGGEYGNAVLSRLPIVRSQNHKLPRLNSGEQRGVLEVEVAWPGASDRLVLLATHLDHRPPSDERLQSMAAINKLAVQHASVPVILAGDLNATEAAREIQMLQDAWRSVNMENLPTHPAQKPVRQIDYVLVSPPARWKVLDVRVLDEPVASDHRPLLTTLELQPGN